jgi:hypothetical protein
LIDLVNMATSFIRWLCRQPVFTSFSPSHIAYLVQSECHNPLKRYRWHKTMSPAMACDRAKAAISAGFDAQAGSVSGETPVRE